MFADRLVIGLILLFTWQASSFAQAPTKALNEEGIVSLLSLGLDEDTVIARIKKGPVALEVNDALVERLKSSGASEAVIQAIKDSAKSRPPAAAAPVTYDQILQMLKLGIDEQGILGRLSKSPTLFTLDARQEAELKEAGATTPIIAAMKGTRPSSSMTRDVTDVALVLDCSGSMKELTKEGEPKMESAKRVVSDLVRKIPDGLNLTFVIYGHEVFGPAGEPRNCQAVKIVRPIAPLNKASRDELLVIINQLKPTGATPIALSLQKAGDELAKNNALCGLIVVTDGLESCEGDPAAEAATLAARLKLTFGVNVVGFGVQEEEDQALAAIAAAGKGKYYSADSATELADKMSRVALELAAAAKPPEKVGVARRAVKVLKPDVDFPEYKEIRVVTRGLGSVSIVSSGKYGDEIRIPSATTKYEIQWVPKVGEPVVILKDFMLAERKVVEIKPEEHLGMIRVHGEGKPKKEIMVYQRGLGSILRLQTSKQFGEILVVPAEKVNVRVDDEDIEEGLQVVAGKLHELE